MWNRNGFFLVVFMFLVESVSADTVTIGALGYASGESGKPSNSEFSASDMFTYTQFSLDYQENFNRFFSIGLVTPGVDIANSVKVEKFSGGVVEDNGIGGIYFSGGVTYNLKSFDNVLFYFGPSLLAGSKYYQIDANRMNDEDVFIFGGTGGVLVNVGKVIVSLGVVANSEYQHLHAQLGYLWGK